MSSGEIARSSRRVMVSSVATVSGSSGETEGETNLDGRGPVDGLCSNQEGSVVVRPLRGEEGRLLLFGSLAVGFIYLLLALAHRKLVHFGFQRKKLCSICSS